jgi:hypothetical protein
MASQDYEEFIAALNANDVRYLIVGAHAVAVYGRPRATKDLDVFLDHTQENAERIVLAIRQFFGGIDLGFRESDFLDRQWHIQLGMAPTRIDSLAKIDGIEDFAAVWGNRKDLKFGSVPCHFISEDDSSLNKKALGRAQDLADVKSLEKIRSLKSKRKST